MTKLPLPFVSILALCLWIMGGAHSAQTALAGSGSGSRSSAECSFDAERESADCGICQCGVFELTLEYLGSEVRFITVEQHNDKEIVFADFVEPGEQFTFESVGDEFGREIKIRTGEDDDGSAGSASCHGCVKTKIKINCKSKTKDKKRLKVGRVFGDFKIVGGVSTDGLPFCPLDESDEGDGSGDDGGDSGDSGPDDENNGSGSGSDGEEGDDGGDTGDSGPDDEGDGGAGDDDDSDGVDNSTDLCPGTPANEPVDQDGCSDSQLDEGGDGGDSGDSGPDDENNGSGSGSGDGGDGGGQDDDSDGVDNSTDLCPDTPDDEPVNSDGCSDSQLGGDPSSTLLDGDDDSDGVGNSIDLCPDTPADEPVDSDGCSDSQLDGDPNGAVVDGDDDDDGVGNSIDLCPDTPADEPVDSDGCSDSQLGGDPSGTVLDGDDDDDGVGNSIDLCPHTPADEPVDSDGCSDSQLGGGDGGGGSNPNPGGRSAPTPTGGGSPDEDEDGVDDEVDLCPDTPSDEEVDQDGCSDPQLNELADVRRDKDDDGVENDLDLCPGTDSDEAVDEDGCSDRQLERPAGNRRDKDDDGVGNNLDLCPDTPEDEEVDDNGCAASQRDEDEDDVTDDLDLCPDTSPGSAVDEDGCSKSQLELAEILGSQFRPGAPLAFEAQDVEDICGVGFCGAGPVGLGLTLMLLLMGTRAGRRLVRSAAMLLADWLDEAKDGRGYDKSKLGKRRDWRWSWSKKIESAVISKRIPSARAVDISESGIGMVLSERVELGDTLHISDERGILLEGRVIRVDANDDGTYHVGVEFVGPAPSEPKE